MEMLLHSLQQKDDSIHRLWGDITALFEMVNNFSTLRNQLVPNATKGLAQRMHIVRA